MLDWSNPPFAKWFVGGKLNVSYNCLDRHVEAGNGDRVAYHWRGEEGEELDVTYADLHGDVQRFANALKTLGVAKGDVVAIYLPMIPEVAVAMLACARIGAIHNVVFGGFSAESVKERIEFSEAKVLITVDGARRKGKTAAIKENVDEVIGDLVDTIVVVKRADNDAPMKDGRDHFYGDLLEAADAECPAEPMDSEDPLYILYTSGSTAKPKGILHTTGGYLTGVAYTHKAVFDLKAEEDIYWCAADVGWVTGHSYIVYGPLANGATSVMYEGAPDYPGKDIWWELVERYKVTIMYCAPTAIRACMKWGVEHPEAHDLSSLRLLGTVGEPINPKAWLWYWKVIGGGRCPIVDTWWQTETGAIMITTLPALMDDQARLRGQAAARDRGRRRRRGGQRLRYRAGLPDPQAPVAVDAADPLQGGRPLRRDLLDQVRQGHLRRRRRRAPRRGRLLLDHRAHRRRRERLRAPALSTAEVESAIVSHGKVAEAAVIGQADEDTGQAITAFVTLEGDLDGDDELVGEIREKVAGRIGKFARPKRIIWADDLPKTRSGKIMRRLLRDIAEGRELGDVTTLRDPDVMAQLEGKIKERDAEGNG